MGSAKAQVVGQCQVIWWPAAVGEEGAAQKVQQNKNSLVGWSRVMGSCGKHVGGFIMQVK